MISLTDRDLNEPRRLALLAASVLTLLALWCWLEHRSLSSQRDAYAQLTQRIGQMALDAERITALRDVPRVATERERPNDALLAQIRDAMAKTQVPSDRWIGNDPSPAVRIPQSPYKRLNTRLSFENITLRDLAEFTHALVEADPSLNIADLRISTPRSAESDAWNADLVVSYLIYSPYQKSRESG